MKETTKKQKKLYTILLVATIAAVILAVTLSLVFSLSGSKPDDGDLLDPPGINEPGDNIDDGNNNNPDDGNNNNPDDGNNNNPDDGDPVGGDPEPAYEMPMASYNAGMEFNITRLVWSSTLQWYVTHNGTDFLASKGTAVKAVYDGKVTNVGYSTQDGYYVVIKQDDGIISTYKSLTADIKVENGETVKAGTILGAVGDSMSKEQNEGPHLHLEMEENKALINPMSKLVSDEK